jgi:hypothetical protein
VGAAGRIHGISGNTGRSRRARNQRRDRSQAGPRDLRLYGLGTLLHVSEIYVGFVAEIAGPANLIYDSECTEVAFFTEAELPRSELAYADIGAYLREYFSERRSGAHMFHYGPIEDSRVVSKAYRIAEVEDASRTRSPPAER